MFAHELIKKKAVVDELQSMKLQCLHDNQTQTCDEETDALAFYTCSTLEEILKELKRRGCFDNNNEILDNYGIKDESDGHCCQEMERLKNELNEVKKRMREEADCEEICRDALERLKELEIENDKLLQQNKDLIKTLKENELKLPGMLEKIEKLDENINISEQEANKIGKDLEGTISLVNDISQVQLKNQQLASAVSAINSRDDQKIIDDLKRQLEQEMAKLRKCQQENDNLLKEAKLREMDLKNLKELNNKLLAERGDKTDETKHKEISKTKPSGSSKEPSSSPSKVKVTSSKVKIGEEKTPSVSQQQIKSPSKIKISGKKSPSASQQHIKSPSKTEVIGEKPPIDISDSDGIAISASKDSAREKTKVPKQKTPSELDQRKDIALNDFVKNKSDTLKFNLQAGRGFEKEFRKILEEFIYECSFYFCRLYNAKSKLYIICHKLCHSGIDILNFQELAYIHKKIYTQADKLLPGCLLDMILTEHKEQVDSILTSVIMPRLVQNKKLNYKTLDDNACHDDQKCCCCRNELCCNNSEEMLKDKVNKLEKDISLAREYLETLRHIPLGQSLTENDDSTDTNNSTYRATSPIMKQQKSNYSKHVKKLKNRVKKQIDL